MLTCSIGVRWRRADPSLWCVTAGVCNDNVTNCVLPLTVQMNSLTVDQAVFDDRKGQIHVKVGYAIQHEAT